MEMGHPYELFVIVAAQQSPRSAGEAGRDGAGLTQDTGAGDSDIDGHRAAQQLERGAVANGREVALDTLARAHSCHANRGPANCIGAAAQVDPAARGVCVPCAYLRRRGLRVPRSRHALPQGRTCSSSRAALVRPGAKALPADSIVSASV